MLDKNDENVSACEKKSSSRSNMGSRGSSVAFLGNSKEEEKKECCNPNSYFDDDTWKFTTERNEYKDPRCYYFQQRVFWYWRHPLARMTFCTLIMLLNFYIYAIDPVCESKREVALPIAGSLWSIVATRWKGGAGWLFFRFIVCLIIYIGGPIIGWWFLHRIVLKRWLQLSMFGYYPESVLTIFKQQDRYNELDEYKGSWFSMSITTLFWGYIWVNIYNAIVPEDNGVDEWLGFSEYLFGQMAVSLSWMGDSFTFFMILDSMLQEEKKYPNAYIGRLRKKWLTTWSGMFRVIFVWVIFTIGSLLVVYMVWIRNDSQFEQWRLESGNTTVESTRAFIGALIFGLDLAIVTQDWDFPLFRNEQEVMITGFLVFEVSFPPECLKDKIPENFNFKINGKWMNYFPMICVMGLDMAAFVALAWYEPGEFAQYVGPDEYIWTVDDYSEADMLGLLFDATQSYELLNYSTRAGQCYDLNQTVCGNGSFNALCNWFDDGDYCAYDNDIKLSSTFKDEGTLWWTCYPFVISFTILVWSLYFLMKYQERAEFRHDTVLVGNKPDKKSGKEVEIVKIWNGRREDI